MSKSKLKGQSVQQAFTHRDESEAVTMRRLEVHMVWAASVRWLFIAVGIAVVELAGYPVAHALAGENTIVNMQVSLAVGVTLTLAGVASYAWGRQQKKRADGLKDRNDKLSSELKALRASIVKQQSAAVVPR